MQYLVVLKKNILYVYKMKEYLQFLSNYTHVYFNFWIIWEIIYSFVEIKIEYWKYFNIYDVYTFFKFHKF